MVDKIVTDYVQIEAIFELGDVDGDGQIDMGEFVGKELFSFENILIFNNVTGLMISDDTTADPAEEKKKAETVDKKVSVSKDYFPNYQMLILFLLQDKVGTARQDLFFFVLFPILFAVFNIFYWVVFLNRLVFFFFTNILNFKILNEVFPHKKQSTNKFSLESPLLFKS